MKRVLFIQPPFERIMGYKRFYTHPGLLSLAAVAEKAGNIVKVYDADHDPDGVSYNAVELMNNYSKYIDTLNRKDADIWKEIECVIRAFNPDVLCVTILTVTQDSAKKVIEIARCIKQDILIVTGGVHPTISPKECVEYSDFVICNEGENVILDIIEGKIEKGIVYGSRVLDLDQLPFPAIHTLHNIEKYEKRDLSMVISTRGCPNMCKFCCSPLIWKRKVTRKSVDYFIHEIEILIRKYDIHDFYISDDSFTYDKRWLELFCEKIKKYKVTWRCLCRIDMIDLDMILLMKEAGCRNVKFGIESGSQRILNMINKNIRVRDIYEKDQMLHKAGMEWSAYFIIGFPTETVDDIRATQKLIKDISAKTVTVSIFTPYPGTELGKQCIKFNQKYSKYYSHHSPYNNFTGTIEAKRFEELAKETNLLAIHKSSQCFT